MKKLFLLLTASFSCVATYAQKEQTKVLDAYTYVAEGKTYCHVLNGTPGAEASFYSERWGGKQLKSEVQDATGKMEFCEKVFSPAFVIDRGTGKVFQMDGHEFSINDPETNIESGLKTISWKATADMNKDMSFVVMHSNDGNKWEAVEVIAAIKTPVELKYLVNDANIDALLYKIIVMNGKEVRYTSPVMSVSNKMVSVYPTVVNNKMTIELRAEVTNVSYTISNISGQVMRTGKVMTGKNEINVTELSAGNYMVNIDGSDIHLSEKIVKQ